MNIEDVIGLYDGFHFGDELRMLNRYASEVTEGVIVAIGSYRGQTDIALALNAQVSVYCIDNRSGSIGEDYPFGDADRVEWMKNILAFGVGAKVRPINLLSEQAVEGWTLNIGMLFIDGSHDYDSVMRDTRLWLPFLLEGGIVAFHDVGNPHAPDVDEAIGDRLKDKYQHIETANITAIYRLIPVSSGLFGRAHGISNYYLTEEELAECDTHSVPRPPLREFTPRKKKTE